MAGNLIDPLLVQPELQPVLLSPATHKILERYLAQRFQAYVSECFGPLLPNFEPKAIQRLLQTPPRWQPGNLPAWKPAVALCLAEHLLTGIRDFLAKLTKLSQHSTSADSSEVTRQLRDWSQFLDHVAKLPDRLKQAWLVREYLGLSAAEHSRIMLVDADLLNLEYREALSRLERVTHFADIPATAESDLRKILWDLNGAWRAEFGLIPPEFIALVRDAALFRLLPTPPTESSERIAYYLLFGRLYRELKANVYRQLKINTNPKATKKFGTQAKEALALMEAQGFARAALAPENPDCERCFALLKDACLNVQEAAHLLEIAPSQVATAIDVYNEKISTWLKDRRSPKNEDPS